MASAIDQSPATKQSTTQTSKEPAAIANSDATSRSVLIAIDRSRHSERALRWYASKMHSSDDRVAFVNVTEPPDLALGFGMAGAAVAEIYSKAVEETVEAAKKLAVNVKAICRSFGIEKIRFLERISHSPGQAIVEAAEEEQADLIILGSRGVGVLRRTFLGSVSDYVLHHSRRSAVLVVPADLHQAADHFQQHEQQQQVASTAGHNGTSNGSKRSIGSGNDGDAAAVATAGGVMVEEAAAAGDEIGKELKE